MYKLLSILSVLIIISTVPFVSSGSMLGEFTVPDWVKNTAGWWASDQISDSAFLQGIQYLIKEGIMIVEIPTEIDTEAAEEVPGWVKNTAGWWAEDKIHDTTFVSGIEYLIGKGIIVVEQEVEVEEPVEEVVEIKDFYMEVNGGSCFSCVNWAHVGGVYYLQIETFDEQHGKYIDGVEISAKIISKGGELRHDFGEVTTDDGVYKNSMTIPNMDWYAGNILSVTGEYFGVEKTIEKEFEVFSGRSIASHSRSYGADAGSCANVGPFSVASQDEAPQGIAFSNDGKKMYIVGDDGNDVNQYTLNGAYCMGTASFVSYPGTFSVASQDEAPQGIAFSNDGKKMYIVGDDGNDVNEYNLQQAWNVTSASFVSYPGTFSVASQDEAPQGIAFSNDGKKMYIVGDDGNDVNEYNLQQAWNVTSASFVSYPGTFSVASQDEAPRGIAFSNDGKKMYIVGDDGNDVNEYNLQQAWNVTSASFVSYPGTFALASQDTAPQDIWFDSSGKTMFIVGDTGNDVNVYMLRQAWNVTSASFVP